MTRFIDDYRPEHEVESICRVIPIAPSTYYEQRARKMEQARCGSSSGERASLLPAARVARLLRGMGLRGVVRGGNCPITTVAGGNDELPIDLVNREFAATRPNQLWIADFTYVTTWVGFVYVAFVIDVFSRMIVGRRASPRRA